MIQAIIFDFDGTLVDTEEIHTQALKEVFEEETGIAIDKKEIEERAGMTYANKTKEILAERNISGFDPEKIGDMGYENYKKTFVDKIELSKGVLKAIKNLKGKFKLGIATPNERIVIDKTLEKFGIKKFFDVIVSIEDVSRPKPDPECYIVAAKKLGLKPENCLVFEDTPTGFIAAKSAGTKCIVLPNPYLKDPEYPRADGFIKSFEDLKIDSIKNL